MPTVALISDWFEIFSGLRNCQKTKRMKRPQKHFLMDFLHICGQRSINWIGIVRRRLVTRISALLQPHRIAPEMYTHWMQFGAVSPIMRTHSTKNAKLKKDDIGKRWNPRVGAQNLAPSSALNETASTLKRRLNQ